MFRSVPEANKHMKQRQLLINRRIHLKHLDQLRPMNLTTIQENSSQSLNHRKKQMITEDRMTEIERQNRILLSKISDIMQSKKPGALSTASKQYYQSLSPSAKTQKSDKHSLNISYRRRQFQRIEIENAKLLQRLQTKKSHYQVNKMQREWHSHKQVLRNMSSFPLVIDKPASSKSQSHSANKLLQPSDFIQNRMNHTTIQNPQPVKSNRQIKISKTSKIDGHNFIVTVKLTSQKLIIQAVLSRKRDQLKIIEIGRQEALDFILHQCGNSIQNIFGKLRYDGDTLYLVAKQSEESMNSIVDNKIKKIKPNMLKIDVDLDVEPDLPGTGKRVRTKELQPIDEDSQHLARDQPTPIDPNITTI